MDGNQLSVGKQVAEIEDGAMIKLIILVAVTLAALYTFLGTYGAGDLRQPRVEPAASPKPAAQDAGRDLLSLPAQPAPQPETGDVIQVTAQTPEQVQRFPGPPLRRSPDHAGPSGTTPAAAELPAATGPVLYITGNRVNFRAGPSTNDRVIGALVRGEPVEALGSTDGAWVNIRDGDGRIGYMSSQFLSPNRPN